MAKENRVWRVECMMCETTVDLPIGEYRIISTDQAAEFLRVPTFICGKCQSECPVTLVKLKRKPEPTGNPEIHDYANTGEDDG